MAEIKLLNIHEDVPEEFYVFVNFNNIVTEHNLRVTKTFTSGAFAQLSIGGDSYLEKYLNNTISYLPFIPNPTNDLNMISMFNNNITSEYRTEYNAELYRRANNSSYPSRLSAIYAFGNMETCEIVSRKYHWEIDTVRKFKLTPHTLNKVVKVNMEIVSLERYANRISMLSPDTINTIWENYWRGGGNIQLELPVVGGRKIFDSNVIWEYLIEGNLTLCE